MSFPPACPLLQGADAAASPAVSASLAGDR